MAGKAGQIIPRGERTWLVRVFMGRDSESGKRKYVNKTIHGTLRDAQAYLSRSQRERDPVDGDVAAADLIFVNSSGNPLNERNLVQRNFQVILERAKLPRIRLYDLRHTAATLALGAGVPAKVVSEQLGHASVAFTLDTYSHVLPHMQEAAAAQVEALLFESSPKKRASRKKRRATLDKTNREQK